MATCVLKLSCLHNSHQDKDTYVCCCHIVFFHRLWDELVLGCKCLSVITYYDYAKEQELQQFIVFI